LHCICCDCRPRSIWLQVVTLRAEAATEVVR
jgi:hypothetical protein